MKTTEFTLSPSEARDLQAAPFEEVFRALTTKAGAWFTLANGEKIRGEAAATTRVIEWIDEVAKSDQETKEPESRSKYPDAPEPVNMKDVVETFEDGVVFFPAEHWVTQTGKYYNPAQPVTIFTCDCGTRRIVHLQDVPQTAGRCVPCIRRDRRKRARERAKLREG